MQGLRLFVGFGFGSGHCKGEAPLKFLRRRGSHVSSLQQRGACGHAGVVVHWCVRAKSRLVGGVCDLAKPGALRRKTQVVPVLRWPAHVPFCGLYLESYKVIPERNYLGAYVC